MVKKIEKGKLSPDIVLNALRDGSFSNWDRNLQEEALQLHEDPQDPHSTWVLEMVVQNDLTSTLPHHLLDNESILFKDPQGEIITTLLHLCATNNQWEYLPKHVFTEENLMVQDNWGNSPTQEAAELGHYDMIIEHLEVLTEKTFIDVNKDNNTTLELLISPKTGRYTDRTPLENIEIILPRILKKFQPHTLKKYYKERIAKNPRIGDPQKQVFRDHIIKPILRKIEGLNLE